MLVKKFQQEIFNDGVLIVLKAIDGIIYENLYENIRYGNRTFGAKRFYNAQVAGTTIDNMIAVPFCDFIKRNDLIELHDFRTDKKEIYEISVVQKKHDSIPASIYLTLKKTDIKYVDKRNS